MNANIIRLVKNLVALGLLGAIGFGVYLYFSKSDNDELIIDDTPIHIESIRTIAEIATVSYRDEVVMDTVEYYKQKSSIYDPREWIRAYDRNIKRRLTLIVKGEVKYGIDLSEDNYSIKQNKDTIWLFIPQPEIIDIIITPSKTEIFQEKGKWHDGTRRKLEQLAKVDFAKNASELRLMDKAQENTILLFKKLIHSDKTVIIAFND